MHKSAFKFDLPEDLIAAYPCKERSGSRLLLVDPIKQQVQHQGFSQLADFLQPDDCLIFNNTKVIPARLFAEKETGGKVEILLERVKLVAGKSICVAQIRASNKPKVDTIIKLEQGIAFQVIGREGAFYLLENLSDMPFVEVFEAYGQMPLPPYIERQAVESDKERYQTVYAEKAGAVAAPTAGLHFDQDLLDQIAAKGIQSDFVTLHVGAGTFSPVRVDDIRQHQMHSEWFEVPQSVVDRVQETRRKGGRVIAVGTTAVRCLESASFDGQLAARSGETDIFITPGYSFKSVDALITNFHLSESTLIMLVSAFAGHEFTMSCYQQAIEERYRFFSYGDSMFIQNRCDTESLQHLGQVD